MKFYYYIAIFGFEIVWWMFILSTNGIPFDSKYEGTYEISNPIDIFLIH